jgi:hypothetical protein
VSDLLVPQKGLVSLEAMPEANNEFSALDMKQAVITNGIAVETPEFAWREAGARILFITTENSHDYLVETQPDKPCSVSRPDHAEPKLRNLKLATTIAMRPIENCEANPDEIIVIKKELVFHGLCRITKIFDKDKRFRTGPVTSIKYLPAAQTY